MKPLKIYMGYDSAEGSAEGAVLIFAHDSKEARKIGWPVMRGLFDTSWMQMAVRVLRKNTVMLSKNANQTKLAAGEAHVIVDMDVCPQCGLFGEEGVDENGICGYCEDQ